MKSTGIVRKVDELGRVVLPIELRRTLNIDIKDSLEIYVESDSIVLPTSSEMTIQNGEFLGWYDNADFKGDAITSINAANGGNITLYAKWDMISTDVTFEMNGGERVADYEFNIIEFKNTILII